MLLYGKNSVFARLRANPKSIRKMFLQDDFSELDIEKLISKNNISLRRLTSNQMQKVKRSDSLQGIVAQVDEFRYFDFHDSLRNAKEKKLSFIFLDRIFDPQNLGAIMRTAACFGNFVLVIPKHKACQVTEAVLRVAQGAENYVPVVMVTNFTNALLEAKKSGFWVGGAVVEGGQGVGATELPFPLCFILGSEGGGIRYGLQKHLDIKISIPMMGAKLSFNVNAAAAIFCYEISRQKGGIS